MYDKRTTETPLRLLLLFTICLLFINGFAQDSTNVSGNKWHYLVQPYLMFPNMNGEVGLGELPNANVDASAGDIFNNLQIGAMLYLEAHNDLWAVSSDLLYMDLNQDVSERNLVKSGNADAKQFAWELAGLRKLLPWLEAGLGARLNSLTSGLQLNIETPGGETSDKSKSLTKTWVDPIIISRIKIPAGNKFLFQVRGDIGGFGIGSQFAWQVQADAGYRFSRLFDMGLSYRIIGIDYETGSSDSRFLYNVNTFGPCIKFGFNF